MRPLLARVLALFCRRQLDDELSDEMSAHLELSTADHLARGMSLEDARRAAGLKFGGALQTAEAYRDRQGFPLVDSLSRDLRYAGRSLRRTPVFAATAISMPGPPETPAQPAAYLPFDQAGFALVVRASEAGQSVLPLLAPAIREVRPGLLVQGRRR
jgi:hypothetical protein